MKQMKVKLEDVCERGTSNLKQSDIAKTSGDYPIYGASGYMKYKFLSSGKAVCCYS